MTYVANPCVSSENPCSQGFSNAPFGGADISSIVRAVNSASAARDREV